MAPTVDSHHTLDFSPDRDHAPPLLLDHLVNTHRIHVGARVVPNEFGAIRVTPNVYTTGAELDALTRAIATVALQGLR